MYILSYTGLVKQVKPLLMLFIYPPSRSDKYEKTQK